VPVLDRPDNSPLTAWCVMAAADPDEPHHHQAERL
jgi:hypothetical protein